MVTLVALAIAGSLLTDQPQPPTTTTSSTNKPTVFAAPPPTPIPPDTRPLTELTNEELIRRLPPARQEVRRDIQAGTWVTSEACVEWERRLAAGKYTPAHLDAAIRHCAILRSSPICFEGEPYHIGLRLPRWLPGQSVVATTSLTPNLQFEAIEMGEAGYTCGNAIAAQESAESFQPVGILPKGTTKVVFKVTITPSKYFDGGVLDWSGEIELPVQLIPKTDPKPIDSPALTALIRKATNISCFNGFYQDGASVSLHSWAQRDPSPPSPPSPTNPLANTLMRLKVELLKDGVIISSDTVEDPDEVDGMDRLTQPTTITHGDIACDIALRRNLDRYTVRVTGIAPTNPTRPSRWYRTQYWSGQYTLPLSETLEPESGMRPAGKCGPEGM